MVESGIFYGTVIDPLLTPLRKKVANEIQSGQKVVDIACGTGAQLFSVARNATQVTGVDLSESMISYAKKNAAKLGLSNASFVVGDATNIPQFKDKSFDVAIMSLALHQFDPALYDPILNEMKRISKSIILVDYNVPLPQNVSGRGSRVAEFFAGREHFRNFKKYVGMGGLEEILPKHNLKIEKSKFMAMGALQMVICSNGK